MSIVNNTFNQVAAMTGVKPDVLLMVIPFDKVIKYIVVKDKTVLFTHPLKYFLELVELWMTDINFILSLKFDGFLPP